MRRSAHAWLAAAAALLLGAPGTLAAQNWRTVTAQRARQPVDTLHVRVQYGAGTVRIGAAPAPLLYELRFRFDADRSRPERHYDPATHTLTVGADSSVARLFSFSRRSMGWGARSRTRGDTLALGIARGVPVALTLELGATDSRIDLANVAVSRLNADIAASDARITFGTPNTVRIPELSVHSAATGLTIGQLGNANAARVRVSAAVGSVDLDLSGAWTGEMTLDLHAVMGGVTLRVPRDVGIRANVSKILGNLSTPDFLERGGSSYSPNWERASRKLIIDGDLALAGMEVVWRD